MWIKITDTNSDLVKVGTSICQNHTDNFDDSLETIYLVDNISINGDITLKTDKIVNVTNYKGTRIVDSIKLKDEGWFMMS